MVTDVSLHTPCSNEILFCVCCTISSKGFEFYQSKLLVYYKQEAGTTLCSTLSLSNVLIWLVFCAGMSIFVKTNYTSLKATTKPIDNRGWPYKFF